MTTTMQNNQMTSYAAYDGKGVIATDGASVPARQMFEEAGALFTVEKRELHFPKVLDAPQDGEWDFAPTGTFAVVRTDTQDLLGIVTKQYELVQNDSLLRMAEFIREEADMDTVTLLSGGERVAFTANLRGAEADVVAGDTVKRRLVGWLGHDGKTGCGACFTNIRVICSNTLMMAKSKAAAKLSIRHSQGANENFERLIQSIDLARQTFQEEVEVMRALADTPCSQELFRHYLEQLFSKELAVPVKSDEGERERTLEDVRAFSHIKDAFTSGLGADYARGSLWSAANAVTQFYTSTKVGTERQRKAKFASANFGRGRLISEQAMSLASALVTV